ncbi:MAG: DNA polymerase III subunit delta', partial [Deltaproteobacteria bacterium]
MKIYGHEKQKTLFQRAIESGRLSHAYLFYGTKGVGKELFARHVAQTMACISGGVSPCETCLACRKVASGNHPDIIYVKAQTQFIKIEDIRKIQEQAMIRPFESKRRVFIIDEADRMNKEAANAILKTLEEPSSSNVFFLITANHRTLLPTVLSRCQKIRFDPLQETMVAKYLEMVESCDEQVAQAIAGLSQGSISRAVEMNTEEFLASRNAICEALHELLTKGALGAFLFAKTIGGDKEDLKRKMEIIQSLFRDATYYKETQSIEKLINKDKATLIRFLASRLTTKEILEIFRMIVSATVAVAQNANRQILLEVMA